jgi:hypothetical protein
MTSDDHRTLGNMISLYMLLTRKSRFGKDHSRLGGTAYLRNNLRTPTTTSSCSTEHGSVQEQTLTIKRSRTNCTESGSLTYINVKLCAYRTNLYETDDSSGAEGHIWRAFMVLMAISDHGLDGRASRLARSFCIAFLKALANPVDNTL